MSRKREEGLGEVGGFLLGLLSGLAIGGAIGLLYAPHRGEIMRRRIKRKVEEAKDQIDEAVEDLTA